MTIKTQSKTAMFNLIKELANADKFLDHEGARSLRLHELGRQARALIPIPKTNGPKPRKIGGVTYHPKWDWTPEYTRHVAGQDRARNRSHPEQAAHMKREYNKWLDQHNLVALVT